MRIGTPRPLALAGTAAAVAAMAAHAPAQDGDGAGPSQQQEPRQTQQAGSTQTRDKAAGEGTRVDLARLDQAAVYDGWSANALLDEDAYNQYGEDIGEVEDIIVGPDGQIQRVVVEGGGFLDIGDAHAAVPWDTVSRTGMSALRVQVAEGDIDDYARFPDVDDMPTQPENFRVRELVGDFVTADGRGYGTVDDVIFDDSGRLEALVVYPAYGYGYRTTPVAVPYRADAYGPYAPYYRTELGTAELDELRPFDYGRFE